MLDSLKGYKMTIFNWNDPQHDYNRDHSVDYAYRDGWEEEHDRELELEAFYDRQAELEEERELITVRGNGSEYKAEARRRALVRDYSEAWMKAKNTCWSDDYHLGWSSKMLKEGIKKLEGRI